MVSADMSVSDAVATHLPKLRRYARALTGDQTRGDTYVAALLETLIAEPGALDPGRDPRVALYAAFQRLLNASDPDAGAPEENSGADREAVARERLNRLTPRSRQALLLIEVEGFDQGETARILGVSEQEVETLSREALDNLRKQTRARVLIIEDEPIIAMDIEALVAEAGHEVTAVVDTHDAAVAAAERTPPDLVLADIALADGSNGVEAAHDILSGMPTAVIFITAYPERLLTGARPEPTFLISKPFRPETLHAAMSQALFFRETAETA